jgi:hypothetical protein
MESVAYDKGVLLHGGPEMKNGPSESPPFPTDLATMAETPACPLPQPPDLSGIAVAALNPQPPLADYLAALALARATAQARLGDCMLLSWYDRDRNFEAPQHVSECHQVGAVPGYVDYAVHRGATLMVDIEGGRFVFFFLPVAM